MLNKMNKKNNFGYGMLVAVFILIVTIPGGYLIGMYNIEVSKARDEACQKLGFNESTDMKLVGDLFTSFPYKIECDNKVLHGVQCKYSSTCIKVDKWGQCTKDKKSIWCHR